MSIYEEIGGAAAVNAAVDIFYRKVLTDDRISHYFESTDMAAQHAKQKAFLTMVFGGPNAYTGRSKWCVSPAISLAPVCGDAAIGRQGAIPSRGGR